MITVDVWKAVHSEGTKFYQVLQVSDGSNKFAIFHYASMRVFTGTCKVTAGQVDIIPVGYAAWMAKEKISEKRKTYNRDEDRASLTFTDKTDFQRWMKEAIASKWHAQIRTQLGQLSDGVSFVSQTPLVAPGPEPETPLSERPAEWGTW